MTEIQEMPWLTMEHNEEAAAVRVHRIAHRRVITDLSAVAAGSAAKVLRGMANMGGVASLGTEQIGFQAPDDFGSRYVFKHTGLGHGLIHCRVTYRFDEGVMIDEDTDDQWLKELLRISTVPILPSFIGYLKERIKKDCQQLDLTCINCDIVAYRVTDLDVEQFLKEGGESGAINLPECEVDFDGLSSLPEYIHAYAQKMVDSAGSTLRPLFDPSKETVSLPPLRRAPFTPQAWLIEAARRAIA